MAAQRITVAQRTDAARLVAAFERWRAARRADGLPSSQAAAAALLGFSQSALSQYLLAKIPLNADALARFASLLGVAPESISPSIVANQRALTQSFDRSNVVRALGTGNAADDFMRQAQEAAKRSKRTVAQQLHYWARLGAAVEHALPNGGSPLDDHTVRLAARHAAQEASVALGERSAESLVAVPRAFAKAAKLKFPKDAFGGSQPW